MTIDYNELTIGEQQLIIYASDSLRAKEKGDEMKLWTKFFKKGFEAVCKTVAKKKF